MELRGQVPELSGGGFFGNLDNFVRAPTEDILSLMPSRLKAEELDDTEHFKIQLEIEDEEYDVNVSADGVVKIE